MARAKKDLGSYPQAYFDIVQARADRKLISAIQCADRKAAIATAHHFNRFKEAMARARHPLFEYALDLMVRVEDEHIQFVPRNLVRAQSSDRAPKIDITSVLQDTPAGNLDEHDEEINRILRNEKPKA